MMDRRGTASRPLRALLELGAVANLSDGELLDRYASSTAPLADLAFEALVVRHGGMVLGACRRLLGDPHDADDAFQATFLILAARARSIRRRDSLGSWLYGVAVKVCLNARRSRIRRLAHERKASQNEATWPQDPATCDLAQVVAEELGRLPDRFRAAVVLCDLEGLSHEEAGLQLGCPTGTVKSRQSRGRDRLKGRLESRGVAPTVALLTVGSIAEAASPQISRSLATPTIQAALRIAQGESVVGIGSATVAALTKGTLNAMFMNQLKVATAFALLIGTLAAGSGIVARASMKGTFQNADPRPQPPTTVVTWRSNGDVLREAAKLVRATPDPVSRFYALTTVALAQVRTEDLEGAKRTAREAAEIVKAIDSDMKPTLLMTASWTMDAAGELQGADEVLQLARKVIASMPIGQEQFQAWPLYIKTRFIRGDKDEAKAYAEHLRSIVEASSTQKAITGTAVVASLTYVGEYQAALDSAEILSGGDRYTRGHLLGSIADSAAEVTSLYMQPRKKIGPAETRSALEFIRRVDLICEKIESPENRPDYDLCRAFSKLGDFEAALRVAHRAGQGPIHFPNGIDQTVTPFLLSMIGNAQGRAGHHEESRRAFEEAIEIVQHDPKLANPIGQSRMSQIAWGQVMGGDEAGALKTSQLLPLESRVSTYIDIATTRARRGDREGSRAAYRLALDELARHRQVLGNEVASMKESDQIQIISIRARMGDLDMALGLFAKIESETAKSSAAREIAKARAMAGEIEATLNWALKLEPESVRHAALYGMAAGFRVPSGPYDPIP